jgi:Electron transfer flavoprotein, beta subunit
MNIIVCIEPAANSEDIEVRPDGSICWDKADWLIGEHDLGAIEAAAELAEQAGGKLIALSAGPDQINNDAVKRDVLSQGADELFLIADEVLAKVDTNLTARVLAAAIKKIGSYDLIICGEGSCAMNFEQTSLQLGEILGLPTINAISKIELIDGKLNVERDLEEEIEALNISMPSVISVTPDIKQARLPTLREIIQAANKPVMQWSLNDLGLPGDMEASIKLIGWRQPQNTNNKHGMNFPILLMLETIRSSRTANRKTIILSESAGESVRKLVNYLDHEGVL